MGVRRDVALVLSGGGINGVLLELGFLKRLRESSLWPRVGWIFGTSAGALTGAMAALDRIDELERFLLDLRPEDTFRPNRLSRLPLLGVHEYALPDTVEERIGGITRIATELAAGEIELVVCATDLGNGDAPAGWELAYSSRRTPPEEMGEAILASAAISALVLPRPIGKRIATDGSWVRNFPLGHAYDTEGVELIVAFRFVPEWSTIGAEALLPLRRRLERFRRVPPIKAFLAELDEAESRAARGEPAHMLDMIVRLMRVAIARNTAMEERQAIEKDESVRELESLRRDVRALVGAHVRGRRARERAERAVEARFAAARFPFRHDRVLPRITVRGTAHEVSLTPGFRTQKPWTAAAKRILIARGYELAHLELRAHGVDLEAAAGA
jgi:predicted acylesterase/phospholipase RssA